MTQIRLFSSLLACALAAGCASAPKGQMDPSIEEAIIKRRAQEEALRKRQEDFDKVIMDLDKSMDSYVEATVNSEFQRAERRAAGLDDYLRKTVAKQFDRLIRAADDPTNPNYRAKAVAALGFSGRQEALDPILNAIRDEDPVIVTAAAFALGVLKDPRTPPQVLVELVEDSGRSEEQRIGAAWSLFQVQGALHDAQPVYQVWMRLLSAPQGELPPWIAIQALRGLSRSREPANATYAEPYLTAPTPLVREMTCICLGYLGNRDSHVVLLTRIGPEETNPNVRLAARKALQALAGNIDRGYDVSEWRRVFRTKADG